MENYLIVVFRMYPTTKCYVLSSVWLSESSKLKIDAWLIASYQFVWKSKDINVIVYQSAKANDSLYFRENLSELQKKL